MVEVFFVFGFFGLSIFFVEWIFVGGVRVVKVEVCDKVVVYFELYCCMDNLNFGDCLIFEVMMWKVLELLGGDGFCFFLMVESVLIDKQVYVCEVCGYIGEMWVLDWFVQVVIEYVEKYFEIFVLVILDYGYVVQIVLVFSLFMLMSQFFGLQYLLGFVVVFDMLYGGVMGVNYGMNCSCIEEYMGMQILVFVQGLGSECVCGFM